VHSWRCRHFKVRCCVRTVKCSLFAAFLVHMACHSAQSMMIAAVARVAALGHDRFRVQKLSMSTVSSVPLHEHGLDSKDTIPTQRWFYLDFGCPKPVLLDLFQCHGLCVLCPFQFNVIFGSLLPPHPSVLVSRSGSFWFKFLNLSLLLNQFRLRRRLAGSWQRVIRASPLF
jgi:hypothetical protein